MRMKVLAEKRSEELLEKEGLPIAERYFTAREQEAMRKAKALGYPVVMKVSSDKIIHKSDVHGVITDVRSELEVKEAFRKLKRIKNCQEVMLQQHVDGHQLLVGIKKDEVFGHALAVGAGGIYTEIIKDATFRICPITKRDAGEMLRGLKFYDILKGARNAPKVNFEKLRQFLTKISQLPEKYPLLQELDINPLFVSNKGVLIADARMVFA